MDINQVKETLAGIFREKKKRIVFWYDAEKEFEESLASLQFDDDVTILRLDEHAALELKIKLEIEDTRGLFILYAPCGEPAPEEDWLFDIRLYSYTFHADPASILLKELNLEHHSLRPYLKDRNAFFRSQERLNRLKKWIVPDDREDDIDLKMLAVVTQSDQAERLSILMRLLATFCRAGKYREDEQSKPWQEIERFGLRPAFWKILAATFGYVNEDSPNLTDFLLRVFATDLAVSLKVDPPSSISHFVIQDVSQSMNCTVFLSQWRTHTGHFT